VIEARGTIQRENRHDHSWLASARGARAAGCGSMQRDTHLCVRLAVGAEELFGLVFVRVIKDRVLTRPV